MKTIVMFVTLKK